MPDPGKFKRSWMLFNTSLKVIFSNKKLLLFPLVTALSTVVIILFFAAPVVFQPKGHSVLTAEHWQAVGSSLFVIPTARSSDGRLHWHLRPTATAYLIFAYLSAMFLATFSNVAFTHQIMSALNGGTVSVEAGLRFATSRIRSILLWSLFAGVIGLAIQALERRFGFIGKLVLRLVGMVWSVASVFVIPVMIREETSNPIELLKKSAGTLKKTWGEALIGYIGIGFASAMIGLSSFVFLGGGALVAAVTGQWGPFLVIGALWAWALSALFYLSGVAGQVYRCGLYVYATEGVAPAPYSAEQMDMAWKIKKQ